MVEGLCRVVGWGFCGWRPACNLLCKEWGVQNHITLQCAVYGKVNFYPSSDCCLSCDSFQNFLSSPFLPDIFFLQEPLRHNPLCSVCHTSIKIACLIHFWYNSCQGVKAHFASQTGMIQTPKITGNCKPWKGFIKLTDWPVWQHNPRE